MADMFLELLDEMAMEESAEGTGGFTVDDDQKAEWVLRKLRDEDVVSSSGLIPAGMGITTMSFDRNSVALSAGNYEGKLKVYAYDSMTGEKAITQMEITDLTISVS